MGQIANQMAMKLLLSLKDKIKKSSEEKKQATKKNCNKRK